MKMLNHTNTSVLTATTTETLLSLPQQLKQQLIQLKQKPLLPAPKLNSIAVLGQ